MTADPLTPAEAVAIAAVLEARAIANEAPAAPDPEESES